MRRGGVPIVRYEDLLAAPEEQAARILRHLGLGRSNERSRARLTTNRSSARSKLSSSAAKPAGKISARWKKWDSGEKKLPVPLQARFGDELSDDLARWGYSA
jgi:hypothetical protein